MTIHNNQLPSEITAEALVELKSMAVQSSRKRARIIMHDGHDDPMQEMLIALTRDSYVMPHRQIDRVKTYIVLEGTLLLVFFTDGGDIQSVHRLSREETGIIRFLTNAWHTVVSLSESCVYMEIAQGPFEGSQWAGWAPKDENSTEAMEFMERLRALTPDRQAKAF